MASAALSVVSAGPLLDQILDLTYEIWHEGLSRTAYTAYYAAQLKTPWGRAHLRRFALVDGDVVLASAKQYELSAILDGRAVRIAGIGAVFTPPVHRGRGHARRLLEHILDRAASDGVPLVLLFSEIGTEYYRRLGFETIPGTDLGLRVLEPIAPGAPAMLVRAGDDRDLPAIAEMGRRRAESFRFHLERDRDLIHYAIAKKRVLAGLSPAPARQLLFFVAEEGASAVAYVVVSVRAEGDWVLEECGDRDVSGARVGAILQTLVASQPAERRPVIVSRLPAGFLPPQLTIVDVRPTAEIMMIRSLTVPDVTMRPLASGDVLYWRADLF
jgi:GNAT superfamily N-acetyltransferase